MINLCLGHLFVTGLELQLAIILYFQKLPQVIQRQIVLLQVLKLMIHAFGAFLLNLFVFRQTFQLWNLVFVHFLITKRRLNNHNNL